MKPILWLALSMLIATPALAGERAAPVVVELFTSQGCNSCPPADAYLGELSKRQDVLALSLHVDYWDYIGWRDPFAQHQFTERQREYSHALAQRYVYTPQIVVNGKLQGVGSDKGDIDQLITRALKDNSPRPVIEVGNGTVSIERGPSEPAIVWLVTFDAQHRTSVARGENAGKRLANYNVVREWRELGRYQGEKVTLPMTFDAATMGGRGCAILVQQRTNNGPGPIIAAQVVDPLPIN
jgi:hypothetical protein